MKLGWAELKQIAYFVPAYHVALCITFLFFYQLSFSSGIVNFYNAYDIIRVSYREIGVGYFAAFVAILIVVSFASLSKKLALSIDLTSELSGKFNWLIWSVKYLPVIALSVSAMTLWYSMYKIIGHSTYTPILYLLFCSIYIYMVRDFFEGNLSVYKGLITIALMPFITVSITASTMGDLERIMHVRDLRVGRAACGDASIIRSIGDYYLVVDSKDRRILVDDKCIERFYLSTGPIGKAERQIEMIALKNGQAGELQ